VSVRTLDAASGAARGRLELDDAVDARLTPHCPLFPAQRPPHGGVGPQENALTLVAEVRTVVDELQLGESEDVLPELAQETMGFQRSCIHDVAPGSAVAYRVQGVDNDPEGGAVLGVVCSDSVLQPHVGLVYPPATPKRASKTRHPGFGPPKAEVDGDVLQPVRESWEVNVPVDQSEHIGSTFTEPCGDCRFVGRVPLAHAAKEGRLVAPVVEDSEVREIVGKIDKTLPDGFLLPGAVSPKRMPRDPRGRHLKHSDEVIGVGLGIALDV
jgi:hypothetical protein